MRPRTAACGCPFGFAEKLFDKTRIGMRVIISPNDAAPVEFSHPALFVPKAEAIAAAPARAETLAREAAEAAKAADEAKKAAAAAARETASLAASLRKLKSLKARADAELAAADKALAAAKTDQAKARAEERKQKAAPRPRKRRRSSTPPRPTRSRSSMPPPQRTPPRRPRPGRPPPPRRREAKLALEPVSIYISRATQKLYVRRNTHKPRPDGGEVFDATIEVPVTIRNPDKPIGTHVFTAMARNDAGLRWTAVTIDDGDDAKDALDRITIPQDVLDRIAPTALPRSSIIISDEPLSAETNYRTEFVAVLSNQVETSPAADAGEPARECRRDRSALPDSLCRCCGGGCCRLPRYGTGPVRDIGRRVRPARRAQRLDRISDGGAYQRLTPD